MNGIDFRGTFATLIGSKYPTCTLTQYTPGSYDINNPTSGTAKTSIDYSCSSQVASYNESLRESDQVRTVAATLIVFLGTLPFGVVPRAGDRLTFTIPGTGTLTSAIIQEGVEMNDSGATATCKVLG